MPLLRTIDAACSDLSVGRTKLYQLIAERRLDAVKQGRHRTYITASSIARYVSSLPGISDGNADAPAVEPFGKRRVSAEAPSAQR